jgi:SEC-C motif-containing protein
MRTCPCGLPQPYEACCGRYHRGVEAGGETAPTAVALMRSRYSAFALADETYLLDTWDPATRPVALGLDPRRKWTGLQIVATTRGGLFDDEGTVRFRASYADRGRDGVQEENSLFRRTDGRWHYVGGTLRG